MLFCHSVLKDDVVCGKQTWWVSNDDVGQQRQKCNRNPDFPRIWCKLFFFETAARNSRENEAIMTWWTWGQWCHLASPANCALLPCWFYSSKCYGSKEKSALTAILSVVTAVTRKGEESRVLPMKRKRWNCYFAKKKKNSTFLWVAMAWVNSCILENRLPWKVRFHGMEWGKNSSHISHAHCFIRKFTF